MNVKVIGIDLVRNGPAFDRGRPFSAALGLVPQHSCVWQVFLTR